MQLLIHHVCLKHQSIQSVYPTNIQLLLYSQYFAYLHNNKDFLNIHRAHNDYDCMQSIFIENR